MEYHSCRILRAENREQAHILFYKEVYAKHLNTACTGAQNIHHTTLQLRLTEKQYNTRHTHAMKIKMDLSITCTGQEEYEVSL